MQNYAAHFVQVCLLASAAVQVTTNTNATTNATASVTQAPSSLTSTHHNTTKQHQLSSVAQSTTPASTTLTSTTTATTTTTADPVDKTWSPHCDVGPIEPLAIDDPVMICVFLSVSPPKKMIFKIVVEEYISLKLVGSKDIARGAQLTSDGQLVTSNESQAAVNDIHTWIARSDAGYAQPLDCNGDDDFEARGAFVSCPQIFASGSHVAHMLSLVVNLRNGLITSFYWDNGCDACGGQRCMKSALSLDKSMIPGAEKLGTGSCGRTYVKCQDKQGACDLEILVTWAGTDKDGRHLTTAGRRLSKFGGATLGSMYETMDYEMR
jgi:hypothetical protein